MVPVRTMYWSHTAKMAQVMWCDSGAPARSQSGVGRQVRFAKGGER